MCKLINFVFLSLFILLTACGKKEVPKECQEMFPALEALNLELDTNSYVSTELAEDRKKYFTTVTNNYKKQGSIQNCKMYSNVLKDRLEFLKDAKSVEEAEYLLPPIKA